MDIACSCLSISEQDFETAILNGAKLFDEIQAKIGVGECCKGCMEDIKMLVDYLLQNR